MNIIQVEHNINYLLERIWNKQQTENFQQKCFKIIHKYAMYFTGDKNHLQDYKENKITLMGLFHILTTDIIHTFKQDRGHVPSCTSPSCHVPPGAAPLPVAPVLAAPVLTAPLPVAPVLTAPLPVAPVPPGPAVHVALPGNNRLKDEIIHEFISDLIDLLYN